MVLRPPNNAIFTSKNDPKDPRLGDWLTRWDGNGSIKEALRGATAAIVGWPDDRGIIANRGRLGASQAPDAIRDRLYRMTLGIDGALKGKKLVDLGNLLLSTSLENDHQAAASVVESVAQEGVPMIVLGGGNDYAFADLLGLRKGISADIELGLVNIDAHFDVRDLSFGVTSGTPFYRILELKPPILQGANFVEFAIQAERNSVEHYQYVRNHGGAVILLDSLQVRGVKKVFFQTLARLKQDCGAISVSLDMDSVRQSDAPGVSAPSANGLSAEDVLAIAEVAGNDKTVRLFSVYEVSPPLDRDRQTSTLAAQAIWHFLHEVACRDPDQ